jgi:hypothetical protein
MTYRQQNLQTGWVEAAAPILPQKTVARRAAQVAERMRNSAIRLTIVESAAGAMEAAYQQASRLDTEPV